MLPAFQMGMIGAAGGSGGATFDVHFSSVVLLMHFNGVDAGTDFVCARTGRAITREGNPVISTAQSLYGGTSGYFDGSGDRLLLGGTALDFNLGGTYTIEFAIYPLSMPGAGNWCRLFLTGINGAAQTLVVQFDSTGSIGVGIAFGGTTGTFTAAGALTTGSWQRFAISVNAGAVKIFKNGVEIASGSVTQQAAGTAGNIYIGFDTVSTVNFNFHGYLDEFRITKGIARYSSNYTVEAGPFADSSDPYAGQVLADAPSLYYRLIETTGTVADDIGSLNADGTYTGGFTLNQAGFVPGGKSVLFGGSASAGRVVGSTQNLTSACTVECWINAAASGHGTDDIAFIVTKISYYADTTSDFPIALAWRPSTGRVELRLANSGDYALDMTLQSAPLTPGQNYHVVGVYRASGLCELYINGDLAASSTIGFTISTNSRAWTIGGATPFSVPASNCAFAGRIGEVAIYGSALSAARVAAHYALRSPSVNSTASGATMAPTASLIAGSASGGSAATYRYWRVSGLTIPAGGNFFEVSELQLWSGASRATGATLTSSDAPIGGGGVSAIDDDNTGTRPYWSEATAEGAGFWIQWDFGAGNEKAIDGFKQGGFDTSNRFTETLTLEYSSNGSSWSTKGSVSGLTYPGNNTLSALIPI